MTLSSPLFFLALALAVVGFYMIPDRARAIYMLSLSYLFYAINSRLYLILLIGASAAVYVLGLRIAGAQSSKAKLTYMVVGVATIVAVLIAFKAGGELVGLLLPLGLSYYSFKLISYLIEVYWDDESLERDPVLFFLYPAFFPQIVSGPIQRSETFSRQMRDVTEHLPSGAQLEAGFSYILGGLMMKLLVGDRLHAFVSAVDAAPGDYGYGVLLATVACYTLQLYADFAGYTNIALGIGMLFGVQGPPNFNAPFAAVDIQEMWRRWHMSLTTWVTDYLFMPLSMALRGLGQTGQMICIVLSMVTIGLWHGLTVNFLVFGLLHAAFVSMTVVVKRGFSARAKDEKRAKTAGAVAYGLSRSAAALAGMILTFSLMSFSQIFWHSATWDKAVTIAEQVLGLTPSGSLGVDNLGVGFVTTIWLSAAVAIYVGSGAPGMKRVATGLDQLAPRWAQQGVWLFLLTTLSTEGGSQFVYGQF